MLALCDRFGALPSQIEGETVALRWMLDAEHAGRTAGLREAG